MTEHKLPAARKYVVARADDIPDGGSIVVDVNGRSVGVFHVDGEFYGLLNRCPHQGGPLCRGTMVALITADKPGDYTFHEETKLLECPWHAWEFDVRTGQSYFDPHRTRVRPYKVVVESGDVVAHELEDGTTLPAGDLVEGPYKAETVPVVVENDYVLVTMSPIRGGQAA